MVRKRVNREFAGDNRAVSAVVGFILIFGILVLLLTVYQAQIVPQQNAQTEFEHFEDNKNEMIELRNAISDSGQNDFSRFASVNLGPTYQTRLLTINPAPPAGTLQTHDAPPIKVWNKSKEDPEAKNISTKFIEYQPGYNELNTGPIWYEHSVLYLDERDRGNDVSIIEDQNLVVNSANSLTVTATQNDFQRSGTERVTLELYTNTSAVGSLPDDYRILIPTRLDGKYWSDTNIPEEAWAAEDSAVESDPDLKSYEEFNDEPIFGLNLTNNNSDSPELNLDLNTIGIQSVPDVEEDELRNMPVQSGGTGTGRDNGGEFLQLDASVTTGSGNNDDRPDVVEIESFEITSNSDITFVATEQNGDTDTKSASGPSGSVTFDLDGVGNNEFPVTVSADIEGGECVETTFENEDDTSKSLSDWESCNN